MQLIYHLLKPCNKICLVAALTCLSELGLVCYGVMVRLFLALPSYSSLISISVRSHFPLAATWTTSQSHCDTFYVSLVQCSESGRQGQRETELERRERMKKLISAALLTTLLPAPGLPYKIEDTETRWNVIIAV